MNNAGTVFPKKFEEATLEEFDRVFAINVRGVFVATQAALKHLKAGGRIIMIGSCVGERVLMPGMAPYAATKGAVKMFTQGLAREVGARGITVNNVQPGPIDTDLNPAWGEWAVARRRPSARPLRPCRRSRRAGGVRRRARIVLHHRRQPDRRRRHQRLTAKVEYRRRKERWTSLTKQNGTCYRSLAQGIGRATAQALANAGAHVIVHYDHLSGASRGTGRRRFVQTADVLIQQRQTSRSRRALPRWPGRFA